MVYFNVSSKSIIRHGVLTAPRPLRATRAQRTRALSDVGGYLKEAVEHIFQTEPSDVNWKTLQYGGHVSHDDHGRLRKIYKVVETATEKNASQVLEVASDPSERNSLKSYMTQAVERVFNTKAEDEPEQWYIAPFEGEIRSRREAERMWNLQKLIQKTLEDEKEGRK